MCWVCISSILVASSCLMDSGWLYDCLFESFTQDWLWTYSHDTENTFIDTKNIHYDTVKRYNNYTEKEITELKQHHYVIFYLFVCPRFLLSSSPNVSGVMGSVNPWSAPGRESRVPPALLTGGWGGHGFLSKRTTEKLRRCWPASSVGDKMWRHILFHRFHGDVTGNLLKIKQNKIHVQKSQMAITRNVRSSWVELARNSMDIK